MNPPVATPTTYTRSSSMLSVFFARGDVEHVIHVSRICRRDVGERDGVRAVPRSALKRWTVPFENSRDPTREESVLRIRRIVLKIAQHDSFVVLGVGAMYTMSSANAASRSPVCTSRC